MNKIRLIDRTIKQEDIEKCEDVIELHKYASSLKKTITYINHYSCLVNNRIKHLNIMDSRGKKDYKKLLVSQEMELNFWKNIVKDLDFENMDKYYNAIDKMRDLK